MLFHCVCLLRQAKITCTRAGLDPQGCGRAPTGPHTSAHERTLAHTCAHFRYTWGGLGRACEHPRGCRGGSRGHRAVCKTLPAHTSAHFRTLPHAPGHRVSWASPECASQETHRGHAASASKHQTFSKENVRSATCFRRFLFFACPVCVL